MFTNKLYQLLAIIQNGIQCVCIDKKVDLWCGFNVWAMNSITESE